MPEKYSRADVERFLHEPSRARHNYGQPVSAHTFNQRLGILAKFYTFARNYTITGEDGEPVALMIRPSPCAGIRYLDPPVRYRAMSYEDMERFFSVIPTDTVQGLRDRAIFLFYFWTGRRRSEVARLVWGNIEQSTLVRSGVIYRYTGKGHSGQESAMELPRDAYTALLTYLEASGRLATMKADSPLFVAVHFGQAQRCVAGQGRQVRPLNGQGINIRMKQYAERAGIDPKKLSLHSFRHTAAYERYSETKDILELKDFMGHERLDTTYRYARRLVGMADPGSARLEARFSKFTKGEQDA